MKKIILGLITLLFSINIGFSSEDIRHIKIQKKYFIEQGKKVEKIIKLRNTTFKKIYLEVQKIENAEFKNINFSLSTKSIILEPNGSIDYKYYFSVGNDVTIKNYVGAINFEYKKQFIYKKGGTYYKNIKITSSFDLKVI
ncbi:MAG: hypothetical protein Q9M94_03530 [Candidatus Gracilibacteria bacterium]|nr:hypothetical protein [Candidatus Gracilibacteria bacterium]